MPTVKVRNLKNKEVGEVSLAGGRAREIHIVLDNLSAHNTKAVEQFLDNHPKVRLALIDVMNADLPNLVRMECSPLSGLAARMLTERTGGDLSRVFFCNSGTETVEGALKFARCFTGRQDIVYCDHGFHGLTMGSLALNGADATATEAAVGDLPGLERVVAETDELALYLDDGAGSIAEIVPASPPM